MVTHSIKDVAWYYKWKYSIKYKMLLLVDGTIIESI